MKIYLYAFDERKQREEKLCNRMTGIVEWAMSFNTFYNDIIVWYLKISVGQSFSLDSFVGHIVSSSFTAMEASERAMGKVFTNFINLFIVLNNDEIPGKTKTNKKDEEKCWNCTVLFTSSSYFFIFQIYSFFVCIMQRQRALSIEFVFTYHVFVFVQRLQIITTLPNMRL